MSNMAQPVTTARQDGMPVELQKAIMDKYLHGDNGNIHGFSLNNDCNLLTVLIYSWESPGIKAVLEEIKKDAHPFQVQGGSCPPKEEW